MLESDAKIGQVMAENSFKLLYRLANDNVQTSELHLKLSRLALGLYFDSTKFSWDQLDKLISQIICQSLKNNNEHAKLQQFIISLCEWKQLEGFKRPSCLVWMEHAQRVSWKCNAPIGHVFVFLEKLLVKEEICPAITFCAIIKSLDSGSGFTANEVQGLEKVCILSVYDVFAATMLLKLVKKIVDGQWSNSKRSSASKMDFPSIQIGMEKLIGFFEQVCRLLN